MVYEDFCAAASRIAAELKADGCDVICAITHMRWPNDVKLAQSVPGIDVIFAGHDHFYKVEAFGSCTVVKSGTDFREYSVVKYDVSTRTCKVERREVTRAVPADEDTKAHVDAMEAKFEKQMARVVGYTEVPWDVRVEAVRTQESAVGSFFAGILRARYGADLALLCGGTLRSDRVFPVGVVTARDVNTILPFTDGCVVISVTGKILLQALENSVSEYPKHDGRFPQISGFRFAFDPSKPKGARVTSVVVGEERVPLEEDKSYSLATREYISSGHDGYTMLAKCPEIVSEELGSLLSTILITALSEVCVLKQWKRRHSLLRGAIAAWRGVRPWTKARDESCIVVLPRIDGRIHIEGISSRLARRRGASKRPHDEQGVSKQRKYSVEHSISLPDNE